MADTTIEWTDKVWNPPLPPEAFNVTVLHHSRCEIFDIAERAKEVWSHDCKYPEQ